MEALASAYLDYLMLMLLYAYEASFNRNLQPSSNHYRYQSLHSKWACEGVAEPWKTGHFSCYEQRFKVLTTVETTRRAQVQPVCILTCLGLLLT